MQLGTFGAILNYAIEMEGSSSTFYEGLAEKAPEKVKAVISEQAVASKKNKQTLERTRRMEMQEMILEAITGMDTVSYDAKKEMPHDFKAGLTSALEIETKAALFYRDASKKLGFLPNASKTMEKIGREREARVEKLKSCL